jgi:hypothetical protein
VRADMSVEAAGAQMEPVQWAVEVSVREPLTALMIAQWRSESTSPLAKASIEPLIGSASVHSS